MITCYNYIQIRTNLQKGGNYERRDVSLRNIGSFGLFSSAIADTLR